MSNIEPIPPGQSPLVPHLAIKNATKAIEFYKDAFGATEDFRLVEGSGKVGHAELRIGGALVALGG